MFKKDEKNEGHKGGRKKLEKHKGDGEMKKGIKETAVHRGTTQRRTII